MVGPGAVQWIRLGGGVVANRRINAFLDANSPAADSPAVAPNPTETTRAVSAAGTPDVQPSSYVDHLLDHLGQEAMRVYEMYTDIGLTRQDMINNFGETGYDTTFKGDLDAMRRFANLIDFGNDLSFTREVVTTMRFRGAGKAINRRIPTTPRPPRRKLPQHYDFQVGPATVRQKASRALDIAVFGRRAASLLTLMRYCPR